jgi:ornithine cyclodeaminase/alanine dehydrogenase-like protein (mu-crystallin family)
MPLCLSDSDVRELVSPADALACVEEALLRAAEGSAREAPGPRIPLAGGWLAASSARDEGLGTAGTVTVATFGHAHETAIVALLADDRPAPVALVEARVLRALRAAATSALAATRLAPPGASSLGVLGCGLLAAAHVDCMRAALPELGRVVAYCRTPDALEQFCERFGAEQAEYGTEVAAQEVVVAATSSRDPVLRGDWLRPGALVCAAGAVELEARELDNALIERAAFVCADSLPAARARAGDLAEPVERGVLDWLEVHPLAAVVAGQLDGRQDPADAIVLKVAGAAHLDLALARLAADRALRR